MIKYLREISFNIIEIDYTIVHNYYYLNQSKNSMMQ